jgi:hypothetical protein
MLIRDRAFKVFDENPEILIMFVLMHHDTDQALDCLFAIMDRWLDKKEWDRCAALLSTLDHYLPESMGINDPRSGHGLTLITGMIGFLRRVPECDDIRLKLYLKLQASMTRGGYRAKEIQRILIGLDRAPSKSPRVLS